MWFGLVRSGSGRFGVGFWVGFWVGLRARDYPTERVLSRTPLIAGFCAQSPKLLTGLRRRTLKIKTNNISQSTMPEKPTELRGSRGVPRTTGKLGTWTGHDTRHDAKERYINIPYHLPSTMYLYSIMRLCALNLLLCCSASLFC